MVLGVQWLKKLGPTTFEYENLTIQFNYGGEMLQLQGLTRNSLPDLKMITLERLIKHINEQEHGFLVVVHSVPNQTEHTLPQSFNSSCHSLKTPNPILDSKLQPLLEEYSNIFQESHGMPPMFYIHSLIDSGSFSLLQVQALEFEATHYKQAFGMGKSQKNVSALA